MRFLTQMHPPRQPRCEHTFVPGGSHGDEWWVCDRKRWRVWDWNRWRLSSEYASELQRKLSAEIDEKILDEYKKAGALQIIRPDPAPFKAAAQKVWDSWELKPFGAFVKKLRATGN